MARLVLACFPLCLLLLAACSSAPAENSGKSDGFFVGDGSSPEDVEARSPDVAAPGTALNTDERAKAALLLNELASAGTEAKRSEIIEKLVQLGPRYLRFLRSIDNPEIQLDLAYVINRIEQDAGYVETPENTPGKPAEKPENTPGKKPDAPRRVGGGTEGVDSGPSYTDEPGNFDREQVEKFMAQRLANARQALARGDYEAAEKIAQAALILLPDSRLRPDFEDVVLNARSQGQASTLIAGTLTLDPPHVQYAKRERGATFVKPLTVKCFLKNVSAATLVLTLSDGPGRDSVVELNVRYEQLDYQGNSLATEGRVVLPVAATGMITLAPNETYELSVELAGLSSLDDDGPVKYTLGHVTAKAALRVFGATDEKGQPMILRPINFPARTANVFPADFELEAALARPIQALSDAISKNRAQDLFMASQLIEKKQIRAVGDLLLGEDLETCALGLQKARMKAMGSLTGMGATWDVKKWRAWWVENKLRY